MSVAYAEELEHEEPRIYHNGPWTIEDVEALPEPLDGARYEILSEGVLTVSPSPGTRHQRASYKLGGLLRAAAPADVEILETMYVPIPGGRFCEPDIVVVDAAYGHRSGPPPTGEATNGGGDRLSEYPCRGPDHQAAAVRR
ncbi:MAG: Uma2 family endonuclease, partial [Micromonosporaceae bacterium]